MMGARVLDERALRAWRPSRDGAHQKLCNRLQQGAPTDGRPTTDR